MYLYGPRILDDLQLVPLVEKMVIVRLDVTNHHALNGHSLIALELHRSLYHQVYAFGTVSVRRTSFKCLHMRYSIYHSILRFSLKLKIFSLCLCPAINARSYGNPKWGNETVLFNSTQNVLRIQIIFSFNLLPLIIKVYISHRFEHYHRPLLPPYRFLIWQTTIYSIKLAFLIPHISASNVDYALWTVKHLVML